MGWYMMRLRLSSFFSGAAIASLAGSYLFYRRFLEDQQSIFHKVNGMHETYEERYKALSNQIDRLESMKGLGSVALSEISE